ncbi:substrate-binding domain-containing protein [Mumia xiangluensis]|uniref:Substrate-binding domain-containing protein n=1 Tax=Mumia xiangluensis TaxID=1678900 RepID=A0ABW1QNI4_9ACTN
MFVRRTVAVAVSLVLVGLFGPTGPAQAAGYALIQGSGSSWAANAVNQWVADVAAQDLKVVYTANGAAQGRKDYANVRTEFGITDSPYRGKDPTTGATDSSLGRSFAYLPVVSGGTSFPYHLEVNGKMHRSLRLSGETIAKIFTNQITNWNDPAVTRDNNGKQLPSIPIIPVVRADGAGVTNQFTTWMSDQFPTLWRGCNGGTNAPTDYFPLNCGKSSGPQKAQTGSDGVMNYIKSGGANGSIAMEEYSYPLLANYPVARMLNKAGFYVLPTQYNVAVALTKAKINTDKGSPDYLTQDLDNVYVNADRRTYPLSSYVYAIIPTAKSDRRMTKAKSQSLADFLYHSICQGQRGIGPIGYSPLPINLVQAGFEQIGKLTTFGATMKDRNVSTCNNPTFIKGKPNQNYLAQIAPNPPACARAGNPPCENNEDAVIANPTSDGKAPAASGPKAPSGSGGSGGSGGPKANGAPPAGGGPSAAAPSAGSAPPNDLGVVTSDTAVAAGDVAVVPTTLSSDARSGPGPLLTALVVALFVGVVAAPAAVVTLAGRSTRGRR